MVVWSDALDTLALYDVNVLNLLAQKQRNAPLK